MTGTRRLLILGAAGQLGRQLQRSFLGFGAMTAVDRESADLTFPEQLRQLVCRVCPDVILNAAAYTAVDRAESETEKAMAVNADAPRVLAEEANRHNALLVHYSTDYVFDGSREEPWTEDDPPHPLNAYGTSKLAGEEAVRRVGGRFLIFRTSWVYGPQGRNFLLTMLDRGRAGETLRIVNDQFGAPTSSMDLADATFSIVDGILAGRFGEPRNWAGLYHMTSSGRTTWFEFARAIFSSAGPLLEGGTPDVHPIRSAEYRTPARRPRNSVLSNDRLTHRFALALPPWEEALARVLTELQQSTRR